MKTLLIDAVCQSEIRAATLSGTNLVGFTCERQNEGPLVGNVYVAHVTRVEPSLQAAFIEYEEGRYGFLPLSEIIPRYLGNSSGRNKKDAGKQRKGNDIIGRNTALIVQLVKEGRGNKLAYFSTKIGLMGFVCILHPYSIQVNTARNVSSNQEKKQLIAIGNKIKEISGLTLRGGALKAPITEVSNDYKQLQSKWDNVAEKIRRSSKNRLVLAASNLIERRIRDVYEEDFASITIDGELWYHKTMDWLSKECPNLISKVVLHEGQMPLFDHCKIEREVDNLYKNKVDLLSGGYVVINLTEALVSIDVNSGKMTKESCVEDTAYKANLEAAFEITRQIKLRSLSGIIIIDFIDMLNYKRYRLVETAVADACKCLDCHLEISSISSLGLMQISRQRTTNNLMEYSTVQCQKCGGSGYYMVKESMIAKIIRVLKYEQSRNHLVSIVVHPEIAMLLLNEERDMLCQIEDNLSTRIKVLADSDFDPCKFEITRDPLPGYNRDHACMKSWVSKWLDGLVTMV